MRLSTPSSRSLTRRLTALAAAALLAAGLAGCGSGGDGAAPAATVTVTVTRTVTSTPSSGASRQDPPSVITPTSGANPPSVGSTPSSIPSSTPTTQTPVDLSEPPGSFRDALVHLAAATGSTSATRFQTAGGAVYCLMKSSYSPQACEVDRGGSIQDASYCDGGPSGDSVGRIEFDASGPQPICNSDTIRRGGARTVSDGTVVTAPGGTPECLVEKIGVTCLDTRAKSGYFLTLGRFVVF